MRYLQNRISVFSRLTTYSYTVHQSHKRSNQTHPPCSKKTPMSVFERPQKFRKSVLLYPVLLTGFLRVVNSVCMVLSASTHITEYAQLH